MPLNPGNSAYDSVATDFDDVKEGDFSLNQPTTLYHGSYKYKHENQEPLKPRSPSYQAKPGKGGRKAVKGVYLTPSPKMAETYGRVHAVEMPRKSHMRMDPEGTGFGHAGSMFHGEAIPHDKIKPLPVPYDKDTPLHEKEAHSFVVPPIGYPEGHQNPINNLSEYAEARKTKNHVTPLIPYRDAFPHDLKDSFHEFAQRNLVRRLAREQKAREAKGE